LDLIKGWVDDKLRLGELKWKHRADYNCDDSGVPAPIVNTGGTTFFAEFNTPDWASFGGSNTVNWSTNRLMGPVTGWTLDSNAFDFKIGTQ